MWNWRSKKMTGDKATPDASDAASSNESQMNPTDGQPGSGDVQAEFGADIIAVQAELDDAKGRILRLMADFQNYQRRALQNEQVARAEGVARVASSMVGVVDHFDFALNQSVGTATVEQVIAGVKVIRDELVKELSRHGVSLISPVKNDEFLPGRHEAVMQQPAEGVTPGHIAATFQTGYLLASNGSERVLRPAKVAVAPQA
jgi:molecular chaperone GrpE